MWTGKGPLACDLNGDTLVSCGIPKIYKYLHSCKPMLPQVKNVLIIKNMLSYALEKIPQVGG